MGRKKGSGKAKSAGRKNNPDIKQVEKMDDKMKDDPGGGGYRGSDDNGGINPAMEIANHRNEGKATIVSQRHQQPQQLYSSKTASTNAGGGGERQGQLTGAAGLAATTSTTNSTSTNLKYLHKKFKRIASATLAEEEEPQQQAVVSATATSSTTTSTSTSTTTAKIIGSERNGRKVDDVASADQLSVVVSTSSINSFPLASQTPVRSHELSIVEASVAERVTSDRVDDESSQVVTVTVGSGNDTEGSNSELGVRSASNIVPSDKFGPPPTSDGETALIGITPAYDYHQKQQQQYHQLHPSLHPGLATVASFPPQSLLVQQHHQLLLGHHSNGPSSTQQQQLQHHTSANTIITSRSSSSSSNSVSTNISSNNAGGISNHGTVLLPTVVSSPLSCSSQTDENCDLVVASIAALPNQAIDKSIGLQYVVNYSALQQPHQPPANGGGPTTSRSHHPSLSSSSGSSSGSPSPPTTVAGANISTNTASNNINATIISTNHVSTTVALNSGSSAVTVTSTGRYVCPYCQMNCSKPSVLEKHIRRHTNERPFKCVLCGIAFKTKSNLYKHRRSRAHASKSQGEDTLGLSLLDEDGSSLVGSDIDDKELSNSGSEVMNCRGSPMDDRVNSPQQLLMEKPYKPKFHNAAFYTRFDSKPHMHMHEGSIPRTQQPVGPSTIVGSSNVTSTVSHYLNGQNVETLEQHISKLISQNEAIVEVVEAPLQKKYHKITGISRGISVSGLNTASTMSASVSTNIHSDASVMQHAATSQDGVPSRLVNVVPQKQRNEESQHLQQQHALQAQQQHQYISYVHKQQAQPNVINLTSKPIVTPKSMIGSQQLLPTHGSVAALGGVTPFIGTHIQQSHQLSNVLLTSNNGSSMGDGAIHFQPLNLTKVNTVEPGQTTARASIPTSTSVMTTPLLVAASAPIPSEASSGAVQQNLSVPPYRKRTRAPSPVIATNNFSAAATHLTLVTVCTTTTTSVASVCSVASQPPLVPLHIQVPTTPSTQIIPTERPLRPTATPTPPLTVANHPQNPERSIIKDLLLNSRGFGVVQNPDGENGENLYTCKMCNVSFRDVDSLKYHMICYCQGSSSSLNSPSASSSAPISPIGSPSAAAASYIRSRSVSSLKNLARSSLNPPVGRNPSSLSKLAKSQLTRPKVKPDNISLSTTTDSVSSSSGQAVVSALGSKNVIIDTVQNPLPSPGPLLGNTRLVESGKSPRNIHSYVDSNEGTSKRTRVGMIETSGSEAISSGGCGLNASSNLQLFGGGAEVIERSQECDSKMSDIPTDPFNVHRYSSGGTSMQYNSGVEVEDDDSHQRESNFRHNQHFGGTVMEIAKPKEHPSKTRAQSNKDANVSTNAAMSQSTHFHFPPINSITAYNPLTLPAVPAPGQASHIVHGGKLIPFVQGIPGPNTLTSTSPELMMATRSIESNTNTQSLLAIVVPGSSEPSINNIAMIPESSSIIYKPYRTVSSSLLATVGLRGPYVTSASEQPSSMVEQPKKTIPSKNGLTRSQIWSPAKQQSLDFNNSSPPAPKKSFNFTRMADNISPRKKDATLVSKADEVRHFHFDTVIAKSEILIKPPPPPPPPAASTFQDTNTSYDQDNSTGPSPKTNRFLRPNTLPLKPGTFTPKRHHGITPTHNTMPLISPETPRPSKSCRELYFNGHAYTNIGLKSSTKPFYCTVNKTQPFYFQTQKQLSMYSNWQVHPENNPHPLGLKQVTVLSLYDSNQHRDRRYAIAGSKTVPLTVVNSKNAGSSKKGGEFSCSSSASASCEIKVRISPVEMKSNVPGPPAYVLSTLPSHQASNSTQPASASCISSFDNHCRSQSPYNDKSKQSEVPTGGDSAGIGGSQSWHASRSASIERALSGGFESTEEYTYVRGRGRGKYVCNECGIRCKKPSMLKKHIRTHTDVRPYSCQYCCFHFKTKGNLTKHMKSKSHFKKCTELGLNPVPVLLDDDGADIDIDGDQQSISSERTSTIPGDSDTASETDGDDTDDSEEVKSRLPEREAAEGLLSLSMTRPTSACSSTGQQHAASASGGELEAAAVYITQHINSYLTPDQQQRHGYSNSSRKSRPSQSPSNGLYTAKIEQPRRIITYGGGPKLEFNLLKHEQYYSDPNVGKRRRDGDRSFPSASDEAAAQAGDADDEDDTARPIDLTKKTRLLPVTPIVSVQHQYDRTPQLPLAMVTPLQSNSSPISLYLPTVHDRCNREQMLQQHAVIYEGRHHPQQLQQQLIVRASDVLAPISGTANLLTTLVSNTDKIPLVMRPFEPTGGTTPGGAGVDENAYFHEYLKERALQDTRIKQSQMKPNSSNSIVMKDSRVQDPLATPVREIVSNYQKEVNSVAQHTPIPIITAKVTSPPPQSTLTTTIPPPVMSKKISSPASSTEASAATATAAERVYRIFSGKNERHRCSPLANETITHEPPNPSVVIELEKEKTSGGITPSTAHCTSSAALIMGNECPLVPENASPMDTLAEIAAGSLKLDVFRAQPAAETESTLTSRPRCNSTNSANLKTTVPPVPESAKTLASEYLKLAQAVTNVRKRTESESALGTLGTVPLADQEISDGIVTPLPIVVVSSASLQLQHTSAGGNLLTPVTTTVAGQVISAAPQGGGSETGAAGNIVAPARKVVVVGEEGFKTTGVRGNSGEFVGTPSSTFTPIPMHQEDGGRPVCEICNKKFHKLSQLSIHMNIHYMERKYRCEPCGTSFRSQGLYLKHERSATHRNKVSMTTAFGVATDSNPRPFYCRDCEVGFRIHGHLAKHLRSKMHVLKLECLGKLPFGTYTEIERSGTNLTEIDTSDCENSLSSLKRLATRLNVKDPAKVLPVGGNGSLSNSSSSSSSSSTSSNSSGAGTAGGTSGNETDSCEDNEEDSAQPSLLANGTNAEADRDDDPPNINNNVKRKSEIAKDSDYTLTSTEPKRARYTGDLEGDSIPSHESLHASSNRSLLVEGAVNNSG
ncbi:serine-rich adhesin for platelets [Anopheles maculipalpis]|uniref:serine-rich adhesin for platelets n=1 Tax=Anopheles maculipalpis TaxID=1496333 RepID=UPI002158D1C1|nr:serine-rich adhesin for platelets [Anopheles maculipalpis]